MQPDAPSLSPSSMLFTPSGIYPMQFAFFGPDGELDREAMRKQVEGCISSGVDGIAILGLGTEVNKLSTVERHKVLEWASEDVADRVPLCVTIAESSISGQRDFARAAKAAGAAWIVLQPPPVRGVSESEYLSFFGAVVDTIDLPVGIQNAPEYTGIGVSVAAIVALARNHSNFRVIKAEGPALLVRQIIEEAGGQLAVFNGRCGLELTDNLRAGCAGMVPGAESCDVQRRIFDLMQSTNGEDRQQAERLYQRLLPLLVFMIQSVENFVGYGKRLAAARYGIGKVYPRGPSVVPTPFGLQCLHNAASELWPDLKLEELQ